MSLNIELVHEGTLVGAVDSYLKELVHIRPFLVQRYSELLEEMVERWLDERGANELSALDAQWLTTYIAETVEPGMALNILQAFYRWAIQRSLIVANPLFLHNERAEPPLH